MSLYTANDPPRSMFLVGCHRREAEQVSQMAGSIGHVERTPMDRDKASIDGRFMQ